MDFLRSLFVLDTNLFYATKYVFVSFIFIPYILGHNDQT